MTTSNQLVAGDTLAQDIAAPRDSEGNVYGASAGWTLTYRLVPRSSAASVISFNAVAAGDDYTLAVAAADTAAWAAGWYSCSAYVTKGAETYTVEPAWDQVRILADPRTSAAGYDGRSDAQKFYDDACQALRDAASRSATGSQQQVLRYRIGDREMEYGSVDKAIAGLAQLRNLAALELKRELAANAQRRGDANPAHFQTRLGRA